LLGLATAWVPAGKLAHWAFPAFLLELLVAFVLGNSVLPLQAIGPLSGLTPLLGYGPLGAGFGLKPAPVLLCLACLSAPARG
jgi:hypothetical protein